MRSKFLMKCIAKLLWNNHEVTDVAVNDAIVTCDFNSMSHCWHSSPTKVHTPPDTYLFDNQDWEGQNDKSRILYSRYVLAQFEALYYVTVFPLSSPLFCCSHALCVGVSPWCGDMNTYSSFLFSDITLTHRYLMTAKLRSSVQIITKYKDHIQNRRIHWPCFGPST